MTSKGVSSIFGRELPKNARLEIEERNGKEKKRSKERDKKIL